MQKEKKIIQLSRPYFDALRLYVLTLFLAVLCYKEKFVKLTQSLF